MLRTRNKYCSNCLATVRFLDLGDHLVCERCNKRLEIGAPSAGRPAGEDDRTPRPVVRNPAIPVVHIERPAA